MEQEKQVYKTSRQSHHPSSHAHPALKDLQSELRRDLLTRREFLRLATLLGASSVTAAVLAACGPATRNSAFIDAALTEEPTPPLPAIQRGGVLRSAMPLQSIDHPARLAWVPGANIVRQVAEFLTETGPDNITRPYLLERWEASEDLKTWTLHLRRGIKFNNEEPLTADDVLFNFGQWLDPAVGSSMLGLLGYLGGTQNVEKVDDYTVRLHLQTPNIGVPEHLFHYAAAILPRTFEGDFLRQPVGTGAFMLTEYAEGERAVFKRRADYWRTGQDGLPLPYLDELLYVSLDPEAAITALRSGQVDTTPVVEPAVWQGLKDVPGLLGRSAPSAAAYLLRMRADVPPWNDARVRNVLKLCQDRERILQLAYFGDGELSIDAHVAPIHSAYDPRPILPYDPERARALLTEAGYPDGLRVTLATKNNTAEPGIAQTLKELAAPGGFEIELDITDPNGYWERWTEVDLGITSWGHRPLETMTLRLAYTAGPDGNPTPFNETHWVDEEFTALLEEAEGLLDVERRRRVIGRIEDIMQARGPIGNSFWANVRNITRSEFQNIVIGPDTFDRFYEVWRATESSRPI